MLVTITNISSDPVYISLLYASLAPSAARTVQRTQSQLDAETQLLQLVLDSKVSLGFTSEATDSVGTGFESVPVSFSNANRPSPTTIPAFTSIWNTDENALNWSDGTNWRDSTGAIN